MNTNRIALTLIMLVLVALTGCLGSNGSDPLPFTVITTQPADQAVVAGSAAGFSVTALNATGYQWQISIDSGATFTAISNATGTTYTTPVTVLGDSGTQYRVVVAGSVNSVTSSAVTLTVTAAPVAPSISVHPADLTITAGQDATFSVTAAGTSLSYQWQRSTNGGTSFADVGGATGATLNLTAVPLNNNGHRFHVVVSNVTGSITSNPATLTVNAATAAPVFTTQPVSVSILAGESTQFTVAVTGTPTPSLQWQLSTDGGSTWSDINGATGTVLNVQNAALGNNGRQFRAVATNSAGTVTSNAATLTVTAAVAPVFTTQPSDVTVTEGQNAQFTVVVTGTPTPTLQWQLSINGGSTWSNINGAAGTVLDVTNAALTDDGRQYRVVATNSAGTANSNAAVLTVKSAFVIAARVNHTATLLTNGKVLVAAGVVNVSSGGFFSSAELYDPATNIWSAAGSLATARAFHTATRLANGKVLVTGGLGDNPGGAPLRLASAELYDPATNTWSAVGSLATARAHHTATLLANGKVLVAGGSSNNANLPINSAELFDPATNAWSAAGSFVVDRQDHDAALLPNGRVLLVGGGNNISGSLASAELYDPATNTWSAAASLARARNYLTVTLLGNGKVLAAGGWDQLGIGVVATAELYDPATDTWSAAGSLGTGRYEHTATLLPNGQVLVAAGFGSNFLASAELYDPATNAWSATGNLATARYMHAATALANGNVLAVDGLGTGNANIAGAEVYDIAAHTWQ